MKKLAYVLIFALSLSLITYTDTFAFDFTDLTAKDTDEHWAESGIDTLRSLGVMNGYKGYTNPDDIITRGEFAAIVTRAFDMKSSRNSVLFKDVNKEHIFFDNINAASEAGIIDGFPDATFRPDNMITREEIMLILSRLTPFDEDVQKVAFSDIGSGYAYINQLSKIVNDKIVGGYPDGSFRPYAKTTRAEAATMIVSAMKTYMTAPAQSEALRISENFLKAHFENKHTNASGIAKSESEYINYTYQKSAELGYTIKNEITNLSFETFAQHGPFTVVTAAYTAKRSINSVLKTYNGKSHMKLITLNGHTTVFEHKSQIIKDDPINLTWEVYSTKPSYETPGVNVVSPTCFRVSNAQRSGNVTESIATENGQTLYFNSSLTDEYVNYARENNYEIWAMYKTNFDTATASAFLNSDLARKQSADYLLSYILKYSLDGINFDFENMYSSDKGAYSNHVNEITLMAHTLGAVVSVDVNRYEPTSLNWSMCYDRDKLAETADYIALMAYDQFYSGSKTPGPVSGIDWTRKCIEMTLKEVSAEKLILGMPYYIRCWQLKDGKAVSSESVSMTTAKKYISQNNVAYVYDSKYQLTKYTWTENENDYVLWLEDADSIRKRVRLANEYSLSGVASWRRGFETSDVWLAIKEELGI